MPTVFYHSVVNGLGFLKIICENSPNSRRWNMFGKMKYLSSWFWVALMSPETKWARKTFCTLSYRQDEKHLQKMNLLQDNQSLACFHMCQMKVISFFSLSLHGFKPITRWKLINKYFSWHIMHGNMRTTLSFWVELEMWLQKETMWLRLFGAPLLGRPIVSACSCPI